MFPAIYGILAKTSGAAPVDWWESGGATGAVAAYQPIGAASLAASYTNLANPGTNDAAPGIAPTWDAVNGWSGFNANSAYLTTGISPTSSSTVLFRFSDAVNDTDNLYLFGMAFFYLTPYRDISSGTKYSNGGSINLVDGGTLAGVLGIAGNRAYKNGSDVGEIPAGASPSLAIEIGRYTGLGLHTKAKIQAVAIYSSTLTAPQVAAVSAAMAAL